MYYINRNIFYRHANLLKVIFLEVNAQSNQKERLRIISYTSTGTVNTQSFLSRFNIPNI